MFCSWLCHLNTVQWSQVVSLHLASAEAASLEQEVPLLQQVAHSYDWPCCGVSPLQRGLSTVWLGLPHSMEARFHWEHLNRSKKLYHCFINQPQKSQSITPPITICPPTYMKRQIPLFDGRITIALQNKHVEWEILWQPFGENTTCHKH